MAEGKFIISAQNQIKAGLDAAQKDLADFSGQSQSIGEKIKSAFSITFGDITGIVKGAFSTVGEFVNEFANADKATQSLKAALEIHPQVDTSAFEKIMSFSTQLQSLTGIGDDITQKLGAGLINLGRTSDDTIRIIKLAADYSAATGKSFETSVEQINKTFGGSARELGQLFPELKNLSKEELASGEALAILEGKFGGFSEKVAGTAAVSIEKFNASFGDVKEALGEAMMPAVQPILEEFTKFLQDPLIPVIQSFVPIVKEALETVGSIITALKPIIEPIFQWFGSIFNDTLVPNLKTFIDQIQNYVNMIAAIFKGDWSTAWTSAKNIVNDALEIIKRAFKPLTDAATGIWGGIKAAWSTAWETLKNAVKTPLDAIVAFFQPVIDAVGKVIGGITTAVQFINGEKRVGNFLVDKNNKIIGEYIKKNGSETLQRYAGGTRNAAPGAALVGEEGPELVIFRGGEQVIPNHQLARSRMWPDDLKESLMPMYEEYARRTYFNTSSNFELPEFDAGWIFWSQFVDYLTSTNNALNKYSIGGGALPGLALVGEQGPELVLFNGGEQVIPNNALKNIRGYASGTIRGGGGIEIADVGFGGNTNRLMAILGDVGNAFDGVLKSVGNFESSLTGPLSTLMSALGPFGQMIAGVNPALALLIPVIQGFAQVIGPSLTALLQPLMTVLTGFGQTIGQLILPVFDALYPVISLIAQIFQTSFAPILQLLQPVISIIAAVLDALSPVLKLVAKAFVYIMAPIEWVADMLTALGTNIGVFIYNLTHWFNPKAYVDFTSDAFSSIKDKIAAIDAIGTDSGSISSGYSSSTMTASTSASYRTQSITINIYQEAPVVGSGGMAEFARMIRGELLTLGYMGT